ncbi:hypothetical protein SAMN04488007_2696 [Maribacter aquivivus]|uniref:Uncharacterized protein n=1 Tax=Maribacter aquivivus TaxID=228958 RepID=A0A1M6REF7_9FLAO|nr:hypothetical protein SAMN04488007_2696 [Maribacter aquivivus]
MILKKNFLLICLFITVFSVISCSDDNEDVIIEDLTEQADEEEESVEEEEAESEEEAEEETEEIVEEETEEEAEEFSSYILYENVEFIVDTDGVDTKRFFSTSTGNLYTYNEIDAEIAPTIDLAWYDMSPSNPGFLFWMSPDDLFQDEQIEGGTTTKMENTADQMTVEEFDAIADESSLVDLVIENEDEAMGPQDYPTIVLFENAAGHKGAIKMKSNDGQIMIVDIKVAR